MLKNIERYLEKTIFNSRWILAPFYLGLVFGIILLFIKFMTLIISDIINFKLMVPIYFFKSYILI
ncbi:MAG: YqhA family protein [Psychrobacter alimentarius]